MGGRDVIGVVQQIPFEGQKVVIAAAPGAREVPADFGPSLVDRASSRLPVQESAYRPEVFILAVAHDALLPVRIPLGEFLDGALEAHAEMLRQTTQIRFRQLD